MLRESVGFSSREDQVDERFLAYPTGIIVALERKARDATGWRAFRGFIWSGEGPGEMRLGWRGGLFA